MNDKRFPHAEKALAEYQAGEPARDLAWVRVWTDSDLAECMAADARAVRMVQYAFFLDTADINSLDRCQCVSIADIESLVARFNHP